MNIENPAIQVFIEQEISQTELCEELGYSYPYFNRVVNRRQMSKPLELKIAKRVKKKIHEIFPDRKNAVLVPLRQPEGGRVDLQV